MKEKYDETVTFKGITAEAMNAILDFLYTETIVLTEENISDILHAASIMQIPGTAQLFYVEACVILIRNNKRYCIVLGRSKRY